MRELMSITQALADENRVRILACLAGGELCVCQIIELLAIAPSTTSKHLAILRQARLLEARKEGRWIHYRLPDSSAPRGVRDAVAFVLRACNNEGRIMDDARRLKSILRLEPEKLCQSQRIGESCCPPGAPFRRRDRRRPLRNRAAKELVR